VNIELDKLQLDTLIQVVEREHRMWKTIAKDAVEHPDGRHPDMAVLAAFRREGLKALAAHLKEYTQ
jgi:hypothetical protein